VTDPAIDDARRAVGEPAAGEPAGRSRSILLVAYFYPPCRDTGATRPASMARWLCRLGHRVTVLTTSAYGSSASGGPERVVRTTDAQLWRARLHGSGTVDALYDADTYGGRPHALSSLIVPEPLALAWTPFARSRALALRRERDFDCVITSSPPESAHAVGMALRRRGMPWVADVRDGWTFEPLRPRFPTAAQRHLDERIERRWLGAADAVVCVSEPAAADLRRRGIAEPALVANGWDPELAPASTGVPAGLLDAERVSLVYTGRFGGYGRDPTPLLNGLARLARDDPSSAGALELVIAAPLTPGEAELFARDVFPARVVLAGSLSRERALALQREADALLLLAQPSRSQLLNIKLFEYLAAGRPVLALAEGTEAGRVVAEIGGETVRADDPPAIAAALARLAAGELRAPVAGAVAPYTYPAPAERMVEVIEAAIKAGRGSGP
jgi:glycosyltransferase involved in cell wall biosynthesis